MPRPPSTPQLLETTVRSLTPLSRIAAIRFPNAAEAEASGHDRHAVEEELSRALTASSRTLSAMIAPLKRVSPLARPDEKFNP